MNADQDSTEDDPSLIRPFFMTGGRTTSIGTDLPIETLVTATGVSGPCTTEQQTILDLVVTPLSIAEIGAHAGIPVGVARVLVSDLAVAGQIHVHAVTQSGDVDHQFIRRLLDGVRAL